MKAQISRGDGTRWTTKVFAGFGFAALLGIIIGTSAIGRFTQSPDGSVGSPVEASAVTGWHRGLWYIRLGQWRADARTLIAAVRYVLESDSQTNDVKSVGCFPGLEVAMPTNSASVLPKA
jgi:hypothetical protein